MAQVFCLSEEQANDRIKLNSRQATSNAATVKQSRLAEVEYFHPHSAVTRDSVIVCTPIKPHSRRLLTLTAGSNARARVHRKSTNIRNTWGPVLLVNVNLHFDPIYLSANRAVLFSTFQKVFFIIHQILQSIITFVRQRSDL